MYKISILHVFVMSTIIKIFDLQFLAQEAMYSEFGKEKSNKSKFLNNKRHNEPSV